MAEWIVTVFERSSIQEAALVTAHTEEEAARIGAEWLQGEWDEKGTDEQVEHVFVARWDGRHAYVTTTAVERAELQCCGGPAPRYVDCGGHYATCPLADKENSNGDS